MKRSFHRKIPRRVPGFPLPARWAAAGLLLLAAAAGAQGPILVPGDGLQVVDRLVVGDDLWVDLPGRLPDAAYEIRLLSQSGELLAAAPFLPGAGHPPGDGDEPLPHQRGVLLWPRSGVVGCDCGGEVPAGPRFDDYPEAVELLSGQVLRLMALDPGGGLVASVELPAVAPALGRAYFSDAAGCPREAYKLGEQIWVSLLLAHYPPPPNRLLVISTSDLATGTDVRGGAQEILLPLLRGRITEPVDLRGLTLGGPFYGFLHEPSTGTAAGSALPVGAGVQPWMTVGWKKGTEHPNGGIVITLDGCVSPPL